MNDGYRGVKSSLAWTERFRLNDSGWGTFLIKKTFYGANIHADTSHSDIARAGTPPIFCSNEYFNLYTRQLCRLNHKYSMMMCAPQWGSHGALSVSQPPPQKTCIRWRYDHSAPALQAAKRSRSNKLDFDSHVSLDRFPCAMGVCVCRRPCPNAIYVNYRVVVRDRLTKIRGSLINLALSLAIFIPSII